MFKLVKYLKPFVFAIVLAFALLFGQALCDLSLPNYMSKIVDIGIRQSGIEHAAPDAISENGIKLINAVMPASGRQLLEQNYELAAASDKNTEGVEYLSIYPDCGEMLYIRRDMDAETLGELDRLFGTAAWTIMSIMKDMPQAAQTSGQATDLSDVDSARLYQILPVLNNLPEGVVASAWENAESDGGLMINQSGVTLAKMFYEELGFDLNQTLSGYIMTVGFVMLIIALAGGVATILVGLIASRVAAGMARNLRADLFNKIESFSSGEFDKFSTASLITRTTNDITNIQMLVGMGLRMICFAPILGVGGVIMAVNKSPSMSWIIALACLILLVIIAVVLTVALPKFQSMQKFVDKLNLVARENLSGLMVIRAFGTQNYEKKRFENSNRELAGTNLFVNRVMVTMMPIMTIIMNGITMLVIWVGAHRIAEASMQVGDMMAFMQYAMQVIMSFLSLTIVFVFVPRAMVSGKRIAEVLGTELTVNDPENPKGFDGSQKGVVEFRDVCFRYHGAENDTLSRITFKALPGQTTAIIGPTGSGKSTIISLLLRFYDATEGDVFMNGVNVRELTQKDLRSKIGYVPQKGLLLSGTIASNLRYGKDDASAAELETAARVAQAADFIAARDKGLEAEISQGGANVSGGQKQRLSIARALVKNPDVFVFDDSFSALDFKTDAALRKALKEHTGGSTVIIVSQRVSAIMQAERIIVLDKGRIVGSGTHSELIKNCPEYYEIASSQLSKEELA